jgi:hypothetical protein
MNFKLFMTAVLLSGLLGNAAVAQHSDVELFNDAGQVAAEPRIAEGEFGESPNPAYRADEPGLESDPDELVMHGETPLPGGALVGFDTVTFKLGGVSKGLFYWDGTGSPDFSSRAVPHELKISDPTESLAIQFSGLGLNVGFDFALTADGSGPDPAGFLHSHLKFDLVDPAGSGIDSPAAGVYAFATTFRVGGLANSEPVYWVLASGVGEAVHEAAIFSISKSVGIVPEPGSPTLAASSLVLGIWCRTRKRDNHCKAGSHLPLQFPLWNIARRASKE